MDEVGTVHNGTYYLTKAPYCALSKSQSVPVPYRIYLINATTLKRKSMEFFYIEMDYILFLVPSGAN